MALTLVQQQARDGKLTASRVGVLMNGDEAALYNLWLEMIGSPEWKEPDFASNWPVQLGSHTESLNLQWYGRTAKVTRQGEVVTHKEYQHFAATLDGWDVERQAPIECKHVIQYKKFEDTRDWYMPQLHWQMYCTEAKQAIISVIIGALEPQLEVVEWNEAYATELISRAHDFWACVESLTPPVRREAVKPPVPKEQWRTVDMQGNNAWSSYALDWVECKDAAKKFDKAKEEIKALIEPDVGIASGHGITAKRSASGSISIKETKNGK